MSILDFEKAIVDAMFLRNCYITDHNWLPMEMAEMSGTEEQQAKIEITPARRNANSMAVCDVRARVS